MAKGFGDEDDVQDQIESTVSDAVNRARGALPAGESASSCDECGEPIPEARQRALPGVRLCVACQEEQDQQAKKHQPYNRRGSKDSQLR